MATAGTGHHLSPPPSSPPAIASPSHAVTTSSSESIARPIPIAASASAKGSSSSPDAPPLPPRRPRKDPNATEFSFVVPDEPPHTFMNIRSNHDYYALLPLGENFADTSPRASTAAISSAPPSRSVSHIVSASAGGRTPGSSQEHKRGSFCSVADVHSGRATARPVEKTAVAASISPSEQQQQQQLQPPPRPPKSGRSPSGPGLVARNSLALEPTDEVPPPTPPRLPPRNKGTTSATMFVFSSNDVSNATKRFDGAPFPAPKHPALTATHSADPPVRPESSSSGATAAAGGGVYSGEPATPRRVPNRPPPLPPPRTFSPAQSSFAFDATAALRSPTPTDGASLKAHSSNSLPRETTAPCATAAESASPRPHSSQLLNPFDDLLSPAAFGTESPPSSSSANPELNVSPPPPESAPNRERNSSSPAPLSTRVSGADGGALKREHNLSLASATRSRTPQPGGSVRATPQLLQLGQRVASSLSTTHVTPRASPLAIVVESDASRAAAREQRDPDSSSSSTTVLSLSPNSSSSLCTPVPPETPSSAQASPLLDRASRHLSAFRSVSSRGSHHKSHRKAEAAAAEATMPPQISPPEARSQSASEVPSQTQSGPDPAASPASEEPPPPPPRTYKLKTSRADTTSN